jgi:hypothetical protein
MNTFVVDTNVAISANGRETHADKACQLECVRTLRALVTEVVAIDEAGAILREYARKLRWSGQPGAGDAFFKHVFNSQYDPDRVRRVPLTPSEDHGRSFEELPPNTFDPSDRKFLAVAMVADAVVLNATDSDWNEHRALTQRLGVEVRQLCPQHATK